MIFLVALAAVPAAGIVAFLVARRRKRRAQEAWIAEMADDRDFEPRFPETTAERPVTGRQTVIGRRIARK
jgi:hypothetical protein